MTQAKDILSVRDLTKHFLIRGPFHQVKRRVRAIDNVSFFVRKGETLGIVGESGSGKSTIGKCLIGIHTPDSGQVTFRGKETLGIPLKERRKIARELQYVYQDPGASLDPRWKVGRLLAEPLIIHTDFDAVQRREAVEQIMAAVKLPLSFLDRYPHELSGGQQRRVGLARILTLNPSLVILDEPTSGLDVSVQAAVINLFKEMKQAFDLTYIFISHDLSVVQVLCDRVAVMYSGQIVEIGDVGDVFNNPQHPYTQTLLNAVPRVGKRTRFQYLPADQSGGGAGDIDTGCRFAPRCSQRIPLCQSDCPVLEETKGGRKVACHKVGSNES